MNHKTFKPNISLAFRKWLFVMVFIAFVSMLDIKQRFKPGYDPSLFSWTPILIMLGLFTLMIIWGNRVTKVDVYKSTGLITIHRFKLLRSKMLIFNIIDTEVFFAIVAGGKGIKNEVLRFKDCEKSFIYN